MTESTQGAAAGLSNSPSKCHQGAGYRIPAGGTRAASAKGSEAAGDAQIISRRRKEKAVTAPSCLPLAPEAGEGADLPSPCFYFSLPSEGGAVQCSQLRLSALESKLRAVVSQKGGVRNVMARKKGK